MTLLAAPPAFLADLDADQAGLRMPRLVALDRLRGLAVLLMVVDHVALFAGVPALRLTVGRLAMPLFVILAGHLARRVSWRTAQVALAGVALHAVAPWTGSGPLLVTVALGCVMVVWLRRAGGLWLALPIVVGFTAYANGWGAATPGVYAPHAILGLMALGALAPRRELVAAGRRLPIFFGRVGRFPLSIYAGHAILLTLLNS